MADLQPYRFEPERVPNPEDNESENEEVNDRLEGTFLCYCERRQIMSKKMIQCRILSLHCIGCSKWKNNFSL